MDKIGKSIQKIAHLAKGLDKNDLYLDTLIQKLDNLEKRMLEGLEKEERIKVQKKAS